MFSSRNLINDHYREKVLKISLEKTQVIEAITQQSVDDRLLFFTSDVHLLTTGDDKERKYIQT